MWSFGPPTFAPDHWPASSQLRREKKLLGAFLAELPVPHLDARET